MRVFVGIGSNLDGPTERVRRACRALDRLPGSGVAACSSLYTSPPMGPPDQPDFVNAVAELFTDMEPAALLRALQGLEAEAGRVRGRRWGERTLDLDILLVEDRVIDTPELVVPHPGITERSFVLHPLAEIAADVEVPGAGRVAALAADCPPAGLQRLEPAPAKGEAGQRRAP